MLITTPTGKTISDIGHLKAEYRHAYINYLNAAELLFVERFRAGFYHRQVSHDINPRKFYADAEAAYQIAKRALERALREEPI